MSLKGAHVSINDIAEADPVSSEVYRANAAEIEACGVRCATPLPRARREGAGS